MTLPMQETRFSILLDELAAKQEAAIAPTCLPTEPRYGYAKQAGTMHDGATRCSVWLPGI